MGDGGINEASNVLLEGFSEQLTASPVISVTFKACRSVLEFVSSETLVESGRLFMIGGWNSISDDYQKSYQKNENTNAQYFN